MSGLRRLLARVFGEQPATFPADGSPSEAAARLRAAVKRSAYRTLFREGVVGTVTVERVKLHRYRPMVDNSFAPVFVGRFTDRGGDTALDGGFRMHRWGAAVTMIWVTLAVASLVGALAFDELTAPGRLTLGLLVAGMLLFGAAVFGFSRWRARGDAAYISRVVAAALRPTDRALL